MLVVMVALAVALLLADASADSYQRDVQPVLVKYCYECHGEGDAKGDVALDEARLSDAPLWTRVWENVRNGVMPPPGHDRPAASERSKIGAWLRRDVQGVDCRAPAPAPVTIRRLNRDEYNHTIADLFGIDYRPADDFPAD